MNINPIKQIYAFNKDAGLLADGYSDERECAFPIEEALEGLNNSVVSALLRPMEKPMSPKDMSRFMLSMTQVGMDGLPSNVNMSDVDRLDKHLDIIVFSLGSIFKLGLNPQEAMKALGIVATKNMEKLSVGKDEAGKQCKPKDFVGPEAQLQKILDQL